MTDKDQYAKLVCLFLAEQLRVKGIGLKRAAEIAQQVVQNLNLLDSEADFLRLIRDLARDFEELFTLEQRVFFWTQASHRRELEVLVREFAIEVIANDPHLALDIMQEAIREEVRLEDLRQKFPLFAAYVTDHHAHGSNRNH